MLTRAKLLLSSAALLACLAPAHGQEAKRESENRPGVMVGVVKGGKAVSKPQPAYPAEAKAARASGPVVVSVLVDETGKVLEAAAASGHPLLREAAVRAAYQAKFTPTTLDGRPVKVTGTITYNFTLDPTAHYKDGALVALQALSQNAFTCQLSHVAGRIASLRRGGGERIVGITIESDAGGSAEIALDDKLYRRLTADDLRQVDATLTAGRRVRVSVFDCRTDTGGAIHAEDIFIEPPAEDK